MFRKSINQSQIFNGGTPPLSPPQAINKLLLSILLGHVFANIDSSMISVKFTLLLCCYSCSYCSSQLFWASILVGRGFIINGAYPVYFFPLGRDGFTNSSFSSIHEVRTRPALYKKKLSWRFETNWIMFWPHLDMSSGVFGINKN